MIKNKDLYWTFASSLLNIALWAIIFPVASRYLTGFEMAVWLNFLVLSGVAQLVEFGFTPTLSRSFSYVYAGSQEILETEVSIANGPVNKKLLANLIWASRDIYRAIGLISAILLWVGGSYYLFASSPSDSEIWSVIFDWILFSSGNIIALYFGYANPLLLGGGNLYLVNRALVLSRIFQISISVLGLYLGGGLLLLSISALLANILGRVIIFKYASNELNEAKLRLSSFKIRFKLIKILWHNASRYGYVLIGTFLITRANILIAGLQIGMIPAAGYNLSMQAFLILQSLATIPFTILQPQLNGLWAHSDIKKIRNLFSYGLALGMLIFISLSCILIITGPFLLRSVGSSIKLPDLALILLMGMTFLLELNHGICANLITISNKVPFVKASLITGLAIAITSWFMAPILGVIGIIISVFILQILYNNWYWPVYAASMLNVNYHEMLFNGFTQIVYYLKSKIDGINRPL